MQLFKLSTKLHRSETFAEFAKDFELNEHDLVLTNEFIYQPLWRNLVSPAAL